jgi:urate oxidase
MKQTTYIMAKQHPVNPPELFAAILGSHFIEKYSWINIAHVKVVQHRWTRILLDGQPHPHSFLRDGNETRNAEATVTRGQGVEINSTIAGLLLLKSTGSAFHGFHQDEYTILKPTDDRILSTEVDCGWKWQSLPDVAAAEKMATTFDKTWSTARDVTLKTFSNDNSPSVQNTMYKMGEQILAAEKSVQSVNYQLPNKHYFEIGELSCSKMPPS